MQDSTITISSSPAGPSGDIKLTYLILVNLALQNFTTFDPDNGYQGPIFGLRLQNEFSFTIQSPDLSIFIWRVAGI